jgi:hypothetical protein
MIRCMYTYVWQVYKAIKGGVQSVAVKVLRGTGEIERSRFTKEIGFLKSLSYDRNIVQVLRHAAFVQTGKPLEHRGFSAATVCAGMPRTLKPFRQTQKSKTVRQTQIPSVTDWVMLVNGKFRVFWH